MEILAQMARGGFVTARRLAKTVHAHRRRHELRAGRAACYFSLACLARHGWALLSVRGRGTWSQAGRARGVIVILPAGKRLLMRQAA